MSGLEQVQTHATPAGGVGQATAVEQSRAVAEVLAAVEVAQRNPRSVPAAELAMREACARTALAERAFFAFKRSGSPVQGATVYLARELARSWRNVEYGVTELRRDDERGLSEMRATARDLESNVTVHAGFIVPHTRDKDGRRVPLETARDVYENNANQGARRLRECLFAVLPQWYTDLAQTLCRETLAHPPGDDRPHAQRVAEMLRGFAEHWSVTQAQLEGRVGRAVSDWTPVDLATLRVLAVSLRRGETTRDEQFPTEMVTGAEIRAQGQPARPAVDSGGMPTDHDPTTEPGFGGSE